MDSERTNPSWRCLAALFTSAALTLSCSPSSSVIEHSDDETTGSISGVSQPASKPPPPISKAECPGVDIRPGASTLNVAVKSNEATPGELRYQLSFTQIARECRAQDGAMSIKIAAEGRIVLGPLGAPGSVDVPLHYAVVREGPQPNVIVTKFKRIRATIAPRKTHAPFVDIDSGLSFAMPPRPELAAYVVYVGFDDIGDKNGKLASRKAAAR
jgi:hypothetical protein